MRAPEKAYRRWEIVFHKPLRKDAEDLYRLKFHPVLLEGLRRFQRQIRNSAEFRQIAKVAR